MEKSRLRIVFFGTPEFAAHSLQKIAATEHAIVAVVTSPDKPAGRGLKLAESAVKKTALELGLPLMQPTNLKSPEFQTELRSLNADLGIVIAFRMLPEAVWSMPRLGTFNLHASLLPQYRGAAPINHAIIEGEKETGVTTFFLKHEIDTGDIVLQERVTISNNDDAGSLHDKLMEQGGELVIKTLELVALGNWPEIPQVPGSGMKTAPKLNREFCRIRFSDSVEHNRNKIRGLSPYPGAWVPTKYGDLKIFKTIITDSRPSEKEVFVLQNGLYLTCSDGFLEILELQPPGKPKMKSADFINGLVNKK